LRVARRVLCVGAVKHERELEIAIKLVGALREPIARLHEADAGLADYLRRASHQLAVSLNEARWHEGQVAAWLLHVADESLSDIYAAVELAQARGHLDRAAFDGARKLIDMEHDLLRMPPQGEA
jgi:hypothetical protein